MLDGNAARIDRFERRIVLEGDLTDGDRQRLLAIADRCRCTAPSKQAR